MAAVAIIGELLGLPRLLAGVEGVGYAALELGGELISRGRDVAPSKGSGLVGGDVGAKPQPAK